MKLKRNATGWFAVLVAGGLALSACANNAPSAGVPTSAAPVVTSQANLAALLPADIKTKGELKIGIGPNYPPNEYIDAAGKIVGWDVQLFDAVAAKLGLRTTYVNSQFPQILAGINTGNYDLGVSSFTDNKKREETVDFVTYFSAGTQWASLKGETVDPENACGLRVAAQTNTNQLLKTLPAANTKCTAAGKAPIAIQSYADQAAANSAVVVGKADAVLADSPVIAYAVKQSGGKLQLDGKIYDAAPYGWPVKKDSSLGPVLQKALESLIADGTYRKILENFGIAGGAITNPTINGAVS